MTTIEPQFKIGDIVRTRRHTSERYRVVGIAADGTLYCLEVAHIGNRIEPFRWPPDRQDQLELAMEA